MRTRKIKMRKRSQLMIKFIKRLITKIMDNDVTGMAAQLAYFFLLSLFPLLIFMTTLLAYTPLGQDDLFNVIKEFAPEDSFNMVRKTLDEVMANRNGGLLSIGIIGTIWSASNGMVCIEWNERSDAIFEPCI